MIINIEDDLFQKVKQIVKGRNTKVYEQLEELKPLEAIVTDTNTLQEARNTKTKRIKQSLKETIKELLNANMKPTKYQIHKRTKIAYVTLNKYYDDILAEVKR